MRHGYSWHFVVALALCSLSIGCGGDEGGGGGGNTGGGPSIDACSIVTQSDATQLFGAQAKNATGSGSGTPDPALRSECVWDYDYPDNSSELLQFRIWDKDYYFEPTGAEAFAIGEKGYVAKGSFDSVDVGWVQGEITADLSYSTAGTAPDASLKKEQVKALATAAAAKLPK